MSTFLSGISGRMVGRLLGALSLAGLLIPLAGQSPAYGANQIVVQLQSPTEGQTVKGVVDIKGNFGVMYAAIPDRYAEVPFNNQHIWYDTGNGPVQYGWANMGVDLDNQTIIDPNPNRIEGGQLAVWGSSRFVRSTYQWLATASSFDSTLVPDGPLTLGVTVTDNTGQSNSAQVNVKVANGSAPPTPWTAINSPKEKDTVTGFVSVSGNADVKRATMPQMISGFQIMNFEVAWASGWDPQSSDFNVFYWDNFTSGDPRNSPITGTKSVEILPCDNGLIASKTLQKPLFNCIEAINPILNGGLAVLDTFQMADGQYTLRLRTIHMDSTYDEVVRHITVDNSKVKTAPQYFALVSPKDGEVVGGFVPMRARVGFPGQLTIPPTRSDILLSYFKSEWAFGSNPTDYDWHLFHMHYSANHFAVLDKKNTSGADIGFKVGAQGATGQIVAPSSSSGSSLFHHITEGTRGIFNSFAVPNGPYALRESLIDTHGGVQSAIVRVLVKN